MSERTDRRMRPGVVAVCAALLFGIAPGAGSIAVAQPRTFLSPLDQQIGGVPGGIALDDFNNDEKLDVAVTNFDAGTLSVFLGDGEGNLTPVADQPASEAPIRVASGKFDADDFVDLVATESESNFLFFYKGHGDGMFDSPARIDCGDPVLGCGHDPVDVRAAHMNDDPNLDVVVSLAPEGGGNVVILLGNGDGTFAAGESRRVNGPTYALVVGDFIEDGQGELDVAATALGGAPGCESRDCGTLAILRGHNDGSLDRSVDFPTGSTPYGIDAGDLDKDGHLDVVVADSADDTVSVHRGDGMGNFTRIQTVPVGVTPATIAVRDIDADTWLDVVVAVPRSAGVSVLRGQPGGALGPARTFVGGLMTLVSDAADFNSDGQFDLVCANQGNIDSPPPSLSLLEARSGESYKAAEAFLPQHDKQGAANGDTDGDSQSDLVFGEEARALAVVIPGGETPGTPREVELTINPGPVITADVNGDHLADIIAASAATFEIAIAKAQADGTFAEPTFVALGGTPLQIAAADLDGDGLVDLAAVSAAPPALWLAFGTGGGQFGNATSVATLSGLPQDLALLDFNDDGRIDLAVGNATVNELSLIRNDGAGVFAIATPLTLSRAPGRIASADFDADGRDDIVVSAGNDSVVRVFYGNGDGTFASRPVVPVPRPASAITARDVTGDLRPDLIVSEQGGNRVDVLAYNGSRSFAFADPYLLGLRPSRSTVLDFDGDGRADLGVAGTAGWLLTNDSAPVVLRGDGNGDERFSVADLTALRSGRVYNLLGRIEDIQRGGGTPTAGVDVDGDGLVGDVDEEAMVERLFR